MGKVALTSVEETQRLFSAVVANDALRCSRQPNFLVYHAPYPKTKAKVRLTLCFPQLFILLDSVVSRETKGKRSLEED